MRHCSGTAQSFPKKIRFARRPCAKPPPPRSGRPDPGQISSGASPASPRPDCLDPGPSSKSAEKGGPGPAGPPCRRIGVVAVEPPAPPVWTLILGVRAPPKSDPKGSNFSGFLDPCGAKSRGGGGAPPTTLILLRNQPTPRSARDAAAHTVPWAVSPPSSAHLAAHPGQNEGFSFFVVVGCWGGARFERGGVSERPCGTVSVGLSPGAPGLHPFAGVSDRRGAPTLRAGLPRPGRPFGNPPTTVGLM